MEGQKDTVYDYLLELLDDNKIESWTKNVIIAYLNSHGQVSESEKENLVLELIEGNVSSIGLSAQYATNSENTLLNTITFTKRKKNMMNYHLKKKYVDGINTNSRNRF